MANHGEEAGGLTKKRWLTVLDELIVEHNYIRIKNNFKSNFGERRISFMIGKELQKYNDINPRGQ